MEMIINISLYRLLYFANTHRVKISRYRLLKDKKPDESQLSALPNRSAYRSSSMTR